MQTELEILKNEIEALSASLKGRDRLLAKKDLKIERLEEELRLQLLARFGRKSEVYENPDQPTLFNEIESDAALASSDPEPEETEVGPYKKTRGHRKPLPEFLPRTRIEHDLSEEEKFCQLHGNALIKIGEDISEQLEITFACRLKPLIVAH